MLVATRCAGPYWQASGHFQQFESTSVLVALEFFFQPTMGSSNCVARRAWRWSISGSGLAKYPPGPSGGRSDESVQCRGRFVVGLRLVNVVECSCGHPSAAGLPAVGTSSASDFSLLSDFDWLRTT